MTFFPKHFLKQMGEYIREKEKDKKPGVGTQKSSSDSTETRILDPRHWKGGPEKPP